MRGLLLFSLTLCTAFDDKSSPASDPFLGNVDAGNGRALNVDSLLILASSSSRVESTKYKTHQLVASFVSFIDPIGRPC